VQEEQVNLSAGEIEKHAHDIMAKYSTKIPEKVQRKITAAQNKLKKR
jgi:hypothetical protein